MIRVLGMVLAFSALAYGTRLAVAEASNFSADVRRLVILQDLSARGGERASEEQRALLAALAERNVSKSPDLKLSQRAVDDVLVYVLSGGDPEAAVSLADLPGLSQQNLLLLNGAASFMRGEQDEATKALQGIAIDDVSIPLKGRLALVNAMLLPDSDVRKVPLLSRAAALSPGTLVEDAALRRMVLVAAARKDNRAALRIASRYLRRFGNSLYATDFLTALFAHAAAVDSGIAEPDLIHLRAALNQLPVRRRHQAYFFLLRQAVRSGNRQVVKWSGIQARALAPAMGPELVRLEAYRCSYEDIIQSDEDSRCINRLQTAPGLRQEERLLLSAARAVSEAISARVFSDDGAAGSRSMQDELQPTRGRGESALSTAKAALDESNSP